MHFTEAETEELKKWVVKKLEDISDADSDVLADYVLALVKSEESESQVRANCLENLEDFLHEHTTTFVDDIFKAAQVKSYLPGHVPARSVLSVPPKFNADAPAFTSNQSRDPFGNGRSDQSRKRSWNHRAGNEPPDLHNGGIGFGERAQKQLRRGGTTVRGGRTGQLVNQQGGPQAFQGLAQVPHPSGMPMPHGFPPLDPNNPISAIMAMQALGFPSLPGFPPLPVAGSPIVHSASPTGFSPLGDQQSLVPFSHTQNRIAERCKDYDTKGFCASGSMCPYDHGNDHIVVPGASDVEYDPKNATLAISPITSPTTNNGHTRPSGAFLPQPRGIARGSFRGVTRGQDTRTYGGGRPRASFSSAGPNHDRSITSIVVEQIPEDKFSESDVRAFFSEFGTIEEVSMQAYKRLAVVKFRDWNAAQRAWQSPKVIFDNRFVKVYWFRPDIELPTPPTHANGGAAAARPEWSGNGQENVEEDEEMLDTEEFERRQADAQKVHEEKAKKLKEAEEAKEELDKRIKAQAEERRTLMRKLAAKTKVQSEVTLANSTDAAGRNGEKPSAVTTMTAATATASAQTESLRAKLAELEAEAETLGINPDDSSYSNPSYGRGGYFSRGRGGYDPSVGGRGAFTPRARGYDPSYRGRGRGRGGWDNASFGGAVAKRSLDNRPKGVAVTMVGGEERGFGDEGVDEALRQYLFGIGDFASITPVPTAPGTNSSDPAAAAAAAAAHNLKKSVLVSFRERYIAEAFIASAPGGEIPGLGRVELKWMAAVLAPAAALGPGPGPGAHGHAAATSATTMVGERNGVGKGAEGMKGRDGDVVMSDGVGGEGKVEGQGQGQGQEVGREGGKEVDYDVADDDEDRWMR